MDLDDASPLSLSVCNNNNRQGEEEDAAGVAATEAEEEEVDDEAGEEAEDEDEETETEPELEVEKVIKFKRNEFEDVVDDDSVNYSYSYGRDSSCLLLVPNSPLPTSDTDTIMADDYEVVGTPEVSEGQAAAIAATAAAVIERITSPIHVYTGMTTLEEEGEMELHPPAYSQPAVPSDLEQEAASNDEECRGDLNHRENAQSGGLLAERPTSLNVYNPYANFSVSLSFFFPFLLSFS